jgi:hypothetical protein
VLVNEALKHLLHHGFVFGRELADGFDHELEIVKGTAFVALLSFATPPFCLCFEV